GGRAAESAGHRSVEVRAAEGSRDRVMVIWIAVAVAAGDAIGHGRAGLAVPAVIAAAVALVVVLAARDRRTVAVVAALAAVAAATAASAAWRATDAHDALLPRLAEDGAVVHACGTVSEPGPHSAVASVHSVELVRKRWKVNEAVRVSGEGSTRLRAGERFC